MKSAPLTIIIPCHRNDELTRKAIKSAAFAQEIIVIDQQSGIQWETISVPKKPTIITYPKLTSFSAMKNQAMHAVNTPWLFFLDSDEYVSLQLASEITHYLSDPRLDGMLLHRIDFFLRKPLFHGETRGARFLRIVKKRSARWEGAAHERLVIHKTGVKVVTLSHVLAHTPHQSIGSFIQKIDQYTSLLATEHDEQFLLIKLVFFPIAKFFYTFVIRLGFLDGYRGLVYSFLMALHSSMVRIKRYELRTQ